MPFDSSYITSEQLELFRSRRENAATLWHTIPSEYFDMRFWRLGATSCAIGWLARKHHDGWYFDDRRFPVNHNYPMDSVFCAAAAYFGLSSPASIHCFMGDYEQKPTNAANVAQRLLHCPYEIVDPDGYMFLNLPHFS